MELKVRRFSELSTRELYELLRLRVDVFVVEQRCPYPELDGRDQEALHVWLQDESGIQAYLRIMDRGVSSEYVSIGRVIAVRRRMGLGTRILTEGIRLARERFGAEQIYLEAQVYARGLYEKLGFRTISEPFLEDGIPHVKMLLEQAGSQFNSTKRRQDMIAFLTSSPIIPGTEALNPANGFVDKLREYLPRPCSALFICSDPESFAGTDAFAEIVKRSFAHEGFSFRTYTVLDNRNRADATALVKAAELLILAGGHVPTQNRFFRSIGLRSLLREYSGVVMGISAGSMNSADTVYAQPELEGEAADPDYARFLEGLGLTKTMLLPHYQAIRNDVLDGLRVFEDIAFPDSMGRTIYAIPDGSWLFVRPGREELLGEAYRIRDGILTRIAEDGDTVLIR